MCTRSELQIVLKKVKVAAKRLYGDKLNRIILYGSCAHGDNTKESDIDIMIILDCDMKEIKKLRSLTAEMASDISLQQEVFLSVLLWDKKQFESGLTFLPFYQNIEREGIAVYGWKKRRFMPSPLRKGWNMSIICKIIGIIRGYCGAANRSYYSIFHCIRSLWIRQTNLIEKGQVHNKRINFSGKNGFRFKGTSRTAIWADGNIII